MACLSEEFEISTAHGIRDALLGTLTNHDHGIVVDLQQVTFLDSAGINVLFELAERLEGRQQRVAVVLPDRAVVKRVVELVGLGSAVSICPSVDDAMGAIPPADPA